MARSSRRAIVREFWKNEIREDADELEQAMIKLIEKKSDKMQPLNKVKVLQEGMWIEGVKMGMIVLYKIISPTIRHLLQRYCVVDFECEGSYSFILSMHYKTTLIILSGGNMQLKRRVYRALQKCTAAIRQLAYASPADSLDEYIRMGERTVLDCLYNFCQCVVDVFGARYLRSPNVADTQRLLQMHEERHGFSGMLGSLDCMHWEWRIVQLLGNDSILEAIMESQPSFLKQSRLQIYGYGMLFFGVAGSCNDINVFHGSPLFNAVLQGNAPKVNFTVNGTSYSEG